MRLVVNAPVDLVGDPIGFPHCHLRRKLDDHPGVHRVRAHVLGAEVANPEDSPTAPLIRCAAGIPERAGVQAGR